jgi:signal transduction histidine kinase
VYRVVQEAVNNAVKHAGAEDVSVSVTEADGVVTVRVRDEGHGFDPAERPGGYGLIGMRERVESLGGALVIESAPGAGTTATVRLPVRRQPDGQAAGRSATIAGTPDSRSAASSSRM